MPSQPHALRLLLKLSELVSSMNHRDVQHVQSQGQMNGFPLEVHMPSGAPGKIMPQRRPHLSNTQKGRFVLLCLARLDYCSITCRSLVLKPAFSPPSSFSAGSPGTVWLEAGGLRMRFCVHQKVKHNDNAHCQHGYKDSLN